MLLCWPWLSYFVLFSYCHIYITHKNRWLIYFSSYTTHLNLKRSEQPGGSTHRFSSSVSHSVTAVLLFSVSLSLSNGCSTFPRKSGGGMRRTTEAKWSDRSIYLCCLRSHPLASDIIRAWYIYVGIRSGRVAEKVGRWGRQERGGGVRAQEPMLMTKTAK